MEGQLGMVGLGTMGRNLVLNIADHGFSVCGYDRSVEQQNRLQQEAVGKPVTVASSIENLVQQLTVPRIIMFMVPAGSIVDAIIEELSPLLQKGDIMIDGGNSHYLDTERRYNSLQATGIHFIGMGVSGGEEGARLGPSLMPGGNKESYKIVQPILEAIAAKADGEPCVAFMGNTAAGHYVKTVHNGIEYAIMQMISEVYGLLKSHGLSNEELHLLFKTWNEGELQSFLIEITTTIFQHKDPTSGSDLIDLILDKAKQKGTGLWTSQSALELNVPTPTIDVSVSMRYLSSLKEERVRLASLYPSSDLVSNSDMYALKKNCEEALHFGFLMAYAQGLELLSTASTTYNFDIPLPTVIKVWRAGCIIRSLLLNDLYEAFQQEPNLKNVIGAKVLIPLLKEKQSGLICFLKTTMDTKTPTAALSSVHNYFMAYTQSWLPANLIQAQRDYFGAHTYERVDKEGAFHTDWNTIVK